MIEGNQGNRSIGAIVELDPQEVQFGSKVSAWSRGKISYDEVRRNFPLYPDDGLPWLVRQISNLFNLITKGVFGSNMRC